MTRPKPAISTFSTQRLMDSPPPHDLSAEMCLLGSMILEVAVVAEVSDIVTSADFYSAEHEAIFRAVCACELRDGALDLVLLSSRLEDEGSLEYVGGAAYLLKLAESVPSSVNGRHYARIVADKATLRRILNAAAETIHNIQSEQADTSDVKAVALASERLMFEATRAAVDGEVQKPLAQQLMDQIAEAEQRTPGVYSGVQSGIRQLDDLTGGWQRGDLIVIGARPSMGKTALCLRFMIESAWRGRFTRDIEHPMVPVALFSMEMPREQILNRLICMRAGVCLHRFMRGGVREDEWTKLQKSATFLSQLPLHVDDTPGLTTTQLRSRSRRLLSEHGIGLIIVDYIGMMRDADAAKENRNAEVSSIIRDLKQTARELKIPLIALSQLNRAVEGRSDYRPKMADLRDSGVIEQAADVIGFLHRLEYYHRDDPAWLDANYDKQGLAELIVAKNRNGPTETVRMRWHAETTMFTDWDGG